MLKTIPDIVRYQFIESIIRGGISIICRGHSEAKNKFLKSYDPSKPSTNIMYLDAYNLFGHSVIQLLPTKIFDWVIPKNLNLSNSFDDSSIAPFLELDLNYIDELHDLHNNYPLAPQKRKVINGVKPESRRNQRRE